MASVGSTPFVITFIMVVRVCVYLWFCAYLPQSLSRMPNYIHKAREGSLGVLVAWLLYAPSHGALSQPVVSGVVPLSEQQS